MIMLEFGNKTGTDFYTDVMVGRTNVVVDSVIIFCRSRKTRIFTFFISLEKHLKFIIS
jgi:hypothetical protein